MNDNGTKPTGPIRPTAGQDAQGFRQNLSSMLQGILEAKSQVNRQRLAQGEPPMPVGLPISDRDAAMLMATQAICAHLHHLTVKLNEVRESLPGIDWKPFHDHQASLSDRVGDLGLTLDNVVRVLRELGYEVGPDEWKRRLAAGADQELRRTATTDLEEDR